MERQPQLAAQELVQLMRGPFEKLCAEVAAAVNQAQAGCRWTDRSAAKVTHSATWKRSSSRY